MWSFVGGQANIQHCTVHVHYGGLPGRTPLVPEVSAFSCRAEGHFAAGRPWRPLSALLGHKAVAIALTKRPAAASGARMCACEQEMSTCAEALSNGSCTVWQSHQPHAREAGQLVAGQSDSFCRRNHIVQRQLLRQLAQHLHCHSVVGRSQWKRMVPGTILFDSSASWRLPHIF